MIIFQIQIIFSCYRSFNEQENINSSGNSGQSSLELNGSGGSAADSSGVLESHIHANMSSHYQHQNGQVNGGWIESSSSNRTDEPNDYNKHLMNGGASMTNGNSPDGNFSLLQFALFNFRESLSK